MNASNFSLPPPFASSCECPKIPLNMSCINWAFKQKIAVAVVAGCSFGAALTACVVLLLKTHKLLRFRKISGRFMSLEPLPENSAV